MSPEIVVAIIVAVSSIFATLFGYFFTSQRTKAETEKIQTENKRLLEDISHIRSEKAAEVEKLKAETEKVLAEAEKIRIEAEQLRQDSYKNAEVAREVSESVRGLVEQGRVYQRFQDAFDQLENIIHEYLLQTEKLKSPLALVKLKLIAVAMTFSWENFIITAIPRILHEHKNAKIEVEVLFLDWEFLDNIVNPNRNGDVEWVNRSKSRLEEVKAFAGQCKKYKGRLSFKARVYRNLPHWHGWLFNNEHLFLGRTDWDFDGEETRPTLRVGQNEYRHFDTSSAEGTRRIDLFQRWQRYYFYYASDHVCDSESR